VKILDALILLFLLTGCASRVTLQFVSDELDSVAISHNENFRLTYLECQTIVNELADVMEQDQTCDEILDISVLVKRGNLRRCSKELSNDWKKLEREIMNFTKAAQRIK